MKSTAVRRALVGASVCALTVVGLGAGAASAGETTGNRKPVPSSSSGPFGTDLRANSICAFSGQNSGAYDPSTVPAEFADNPVEYLRTQSYGQYVAAGQKAFVPSPGMACNGKSGFLAGEPMPLP